MVGYISMVTVTLPRQLTVAGIPVEVSCIMSVEDGVLDPRRTVQIGIRDPINIDVITSNIFKIQIMKNFKYIGSHNTIRSRMHEPIS